MGVNVILGAISLAVGVIGGVAQAGAAAEAPNAQREANAIQGAQTKTNSLEERRQRVREERVRRAQIIAASEAQGTSGSSGEAGATSSLNTNFGNMISQSSGNSLANTGINAQNQRSADATARGNTIGAFTNLAQNSISTFGTIFDNK